MKALSFVGGGIRGVLTARVLERLGIEGADAIAGTSVGSINAGCLAVGMKPAEMLELYRELAVKVFTDRDWKDKIPGDELIRADYSIETLSALLQDTFRDVGLCDLPTLLLISTFCLDNGLHWKPKYLHNFHDSDSDWLLWEACSASSAAPTKFGSFEKDVFHYVDGGVMDNNPSMSLVAKLLKAGYGMQDINLLSIGTGFNPHSVKGGDWGLKQWAPQILDMLFDAMIGVPDYQCKQLPIQYHHVDLVLPEVIELDEVDKLDRLVEIADSIDLTETEAWLEKNWL